MVWHGGLTVNKTYRFFEDPGHGWLEVTRQELNELGISDRISSYSYQKDGLVYLEEDCDATLFCQAKGWDKAPQLTIVHSSPRNFQSYTKEVA